MCRAFKTNTVESQVILLGDSSHNTLGAVRSLGEAGVLPTLILVGQHDVCFVRRSKYLRHGNCLTATSLEECAELLEQLHGTDEVKPVLMTTFDAAAEWVDAREAELSQWFVTPCRGRQLGRLFNKSAQCELARECGLTVPQTVLYHRGEALPDSELHYPLITKPLVSSQGSKGDIHICKNRQDLETALTAESHCEAFLFQEFIEKEYEIDAVGVSTDHGVVFGGAVHKYRHWPPLVGAGAFGVFDRVETFDLNLPGIEQFLRTSGYHGPFSVEFVHTRSGENYFMEVNFRNEGLAYASICAGANLHALYVGALPQIDWTRFRRTYLMNYSIDLLYVKQGKLSWWQWLRDWFRTSCFINFCWSDLGPTIAHYRDKWRKR